ncbi:MAG TPA: VOC family protein [Bryobacteraceae bacterium]|nr:VOC family protein [Bryobacteraceae bacterium]
MNQTVAFLRFDGNCREAMEFYRQCFEAELFLLPYSQVPADVLTESERAQDRIMHATLTEGSTLLMAADTMVGAPFRRGDDFSVLVQCDSLPEQQRLFAALGEGGDVTMPLQDTFWGARFGMLTDRFGIRWMLNSTLPKAG